MGVMGQTPVARATYNYYRSGVTRIQSSPSFTAIVAEYNHPFISMERLFFYQNTTSFSPANAPLSYSSTTTTIPPPTTTPPPPPTTATTETAYKSYSRKVLSLLDPSDYTIMVTYGRGCTIRTSPAGNLHVDIVLLSISRDRYVSSDWEFDPEAVEVLRYKKKL
mmetsp:Transcript_29810/g.54749  ORF Transcript_29810/g.54749 Transcript_29810/m.54749 type:complete len:164 (-) Transcript_29810:626-1117(-)